MIELAWTADCGTGTTYGIYRGDLTAGPESLQPEPGGCGVTGTGATVPAGPGSSESFIVVPNDGTTEGSYGTDSAGLPRPPAASACYPTSGVDDCAL